MALVVQKFGGSSVASAERLMNAARRAVRAKQAGHQVIIVVSARGDTTDDLIELAREVSDHPAPREMDMLLATGEQISIALLAMAIQSLGHAAISYTGFQVGIRTDSTHTKARIRSIETARIQAALDAGQMVIIAGFQGIDEHGEITTLGRGGSDTTAVAIAAAMKHAPGGRHADTRCEIYTDVDGVYTTDPRIVPEARKIPSISYEEMLELTSLGAGVMHSRSIEFANKFGVPFQVRNSFGEAPGTWVVPQADWTQKVPVCGVAIVRDEARIRIAHVPDQPGISHRIFSALAAKNIVVDMIAQSVGTGGRADIGFTLLRGDFLHALTVLQPIADALGASVTHADGVSKVSIVGAGMRTHTGVAAEMFTALAEAGVNIKLITTSEIKITVLVDKRDGTKALKAVHQRFGLHALPLPEEEVVKYWGGNMPAPAPVPAPATIRPALHAPPAHLLSAPLPAHLIHRMEDIVVNDVVLDETQGRVAIFELPDQPGLVGQIFNAVALAGVNIDLILQASDDNGVTELAFTTPIGDLDRAGEQVKLTLQRLGLTSRVLIDAEIAKVMVYGIGIRTHTGVVQKMFGALAARGVNIGMISTSEICVSVVVEKARGQEALAALRQAFDLP